MPRPSLHCRLLTAPLVAAVLLPIGACAQTPSATPIPVGLAEATATITERTAYNHLLFLASDDLRGRDTPSPGLDAAVAYIERLYREYGVTPAGVEGSYLQRFNFSRGQGTNVLGMIPGSDPVLRDEYIVVSAHLDHVGIGNPVNGDSIYNGADDNASGTTVLIELARVLATLPEDQRPRRSVIVAHVSAEEYGLIGSRWWTDNPTVPIDRVVANINADMVGSDAHRDTVAVLGGEYSSLGTVIREVNGTLPELNLHLSGDLWPGEQLFFRSDQLNFMRKEIPAIFLFNGLHECYHRPCDDINFVDAGKVARIARLVAHTVVEIANREARPQWDPAGLEQVRRMIGGR